MQTFPPLCIYNFGVPRRTPSSRPPPRAISLRPSALPTARARPPAAARGRRPSSCRARPPSLPRTPALQLPREGSLRCQGVARLLQQGTSMDLNLSQLDSCSMAAIVGPHFVFAKSKCKVPWSWTIFRLCK